MASDGSIRIDIIIDGDQITAASAALAALAAASTNAGSQTDALTQTTNRASSGIRDMALSIGLIAVASKAFDILKSALDGAISRFDTLVGFPVIMEQMGFSSEQATSSINKLSDGIQGLPTTLDGIVKNTQGIAILTGDLDGATETALALNNAFLASGSSSTDAERGLTQYVQMLSKGQVDMMSWRTLQETMGYALKETATAFDLANPNELYAALKDGDITFDAFNAKLTELNGGVGGFAELAKTASAGIATSMSNLKNTVTVGVANMIVSFDNLSKKVTGKTIAENMDGLKVIIKAAFKVIGAAIESAAPVVIVFANAISSLIPVVQALTPVIVGLVAAYATFTVVTAAAAAIKVAQVALVAAQASTMALTMATRAQIASRIVMTTTDRAGTVVTVANTGAVTLSTLAIGVLTGKLKLAAAAVAIKTAATIAWGGAIKVLMGPIGWITAGIGLLVTGVILLVKWFNKTTEEGERLKGVTTELTETTKALTGSLDETSKSYEKNQADIAATAEANANLITKIEELAAVENKTAAQRKEMQSYIDSLNGSVENLGLAYDKETNSLSLSAEQMAARVKIMQEEVTLAAAQERQLEIAKERTEVELRLDEINALKAEHNAQTEKGGKAAREAKDGVAELQVEEDNLKKTKAELASQYKATEVQITVSSEAVAAAVKDSVDGQLRSYASLEDGQKDIVKSLRDTWLDYTDQTTNMFDVIETKSKVTVASLTKNLLDNQKAVREWADNIAKLSKRGIDEGLLDTLRAAGPESAGLVNNIVNASEGELKNLSAAFAKGGDAAKYALGTSLGDENAAVMASVGHLVTEVGLSFSDQIKNADFESLGGAIPQGAAGGIEKGTKDVADATKKMATETEKAFKGAMDINSPSGVFDKFGGNITEGAKVGVTKGTPAVVKTMQDLYKAMIAPFANVHSEFLVIGTHTTSGLNQGLISGKGNVLATARGIASDVSATMRKELDIRSPAGKTKTIGQQTGAGFVKGLQSMERDIEKASKKSAKKAVSGTAKGAESAAKKAASARESAAKKAASAAKKAEAAAKKAQAQAFKEPLDVANYKYKMGEIDASQFIKSLEKTRDAYAKTPEQIRKVNLQIASVQKASAKAIEKQKNDAIKDGYENSKNFIEKRKRDGEISLSTELNAWLRVQDRYKVGTKERIDAEKNVARIRKEIAKDEFDTAKDAIDTRKYYNQLSLSEELVAWQKIQSKYLDGTKEREEADKNVYRVKKEINAQLISLQETYGKKINDISKKLAADELKVNEDTAKGIASIRESLNKEIIKSEEELASKSKAITERSLSDQQKEMDNYLKSVEDSYNKFNNISGGLFTYFKMEPAKDSQGMIRTLESQLDGLNEWEKQIADLSESAIDKGLLEELRAMGPKALPQLKAFNNMTEEQLEKYSALYQEKSAKARALAEIENAGLKADTEKRLQEMREAANAELSQLQYDTQMHVAAMRQAADSEISQMQNDAAQRINEMRVTANAELDVLKTEWVEKIGEINKETKEELDSLKTIGKNAAQGLLDGLASMEGSLVNKARSIAENIKNAMASALDIHSPSRWTRDFLAGNMALGFIAGVDKNESKILRAAGRFGNLMKPELGNVAIPNVNIRPFNPSFNGGGGINGNGSSSSQTTSNSPIYHVTLDAKNVKDFNDVVKLVEKLPQVSRTLNVT